MPVKDKKGKQMPEDFTQKFDEYMVAIKPRTPLNPNDVDELKRRFNNYRKKTIEYGMEFANINAYNALGLSSEQIKSYTGARYADNPERGKFLQGVLYFLGSYREQAIMKGYMPQIPGIFAQKNYDNMRDVQEVQHTHVSETPRDIKSIAARYQDVIDVEFKPKEKKQIETSVTLETLETLETEEENNG